MTDFCNQTEALLVMGTEKSCAKNNLTFIVTLVQTITSLLDKDH